MEIERGAMEAEEPYGAGDPLRWRVPQAFYSDSEVVDLSYKPHLSLYRYPLTEVVPCCARMIMIGSDLLDNNTPTSAVSPYELGRTPDTKTSNISVLAPPEPLYDTDLTRHLATLNCVARANGYEILRLREARDITYYRCWRGSRPRGTCPRGRLIDCPFRLAIKKGHSRLVDGRHNHGPDHNLLPQPGDHFSPWQVDEEYTWSYLQTVKKNRSRLRVSYTER